jgi:hypothetical protein
MRWLCLPAVFAATLLSGQSNITGRVVDAVSGAPLPYCTVARIGHAQGTITNEEGIYQLSLAQPQDSVRFSYIGYHPHTRPLNAALDGLDIRLAPMAVQLAEATIRPDATLYDRVVRANRWIRRAPGVRSKLFFAVDTYCEGLPVEMIHAYFNASMIGGKLINLGLKNGRIGIASHGGRFFVNYNTTKAFALMDMTADESPFPTSPFKHTVPRLLRKGFIVELVSLAATADGVDHLRIVPRHNNTRAFSADLWLAHDGDAVHGLELHCDACPQHPFRLLFDHGRLDTVDLRIRQSWNTGPTPFPEVMQLDYRMVYTSPGTTDSFTSRAVMHAFDPTSTFTLPYFRYPEEVPDYRKIGWLPADTLFWQRTQAPLPSARQQQDMAFLRMNDLNAGAWYGELDNARNFFRPPYAVWSADRRIRMSDLATAARDPLVGTGPDIKPRMSELVAQIYLDVDTIDGQLIHRSFTVADGYRTMVPREREPWTDCFHNIWLDLCEIQRRKMEAQLARPGTTLARAQALHIHYTKVLDRLGRRLLQETGNGTLCEPLYHWNAVVKEALGIDNIALLGM